MILDPAARTVTHLVIEPKHRRENGRLVPLELVDTAGAHEIRLRCTLQEFDQLEPSQEVDLEEGVDYQGGYGAASSGTARAAAGPAERPPPGRNRSRATVEPAAWGSAVLSPVRPSAAL